MAKFMYTVGLVWTILWALSTFWTHIFMSAGTFLSAGMVAVIIVAVITWIPDLEITFEDDDRE